MDAHSEVNAPTSMEEVEQVRSCYAVAIAFRASLTRRPACQTLLPTRHTEAHRTDRHPTQALATLARRMAARRRFARLTRPERTLLRGSNISDQTQQ